MTTQIRFPDRTAGSTYIPIEVRFEDEDGYSIDLTFVDHVQIRAKNVVSDSLLIDKAMTIYDATNGVARYSLTPAESSSIGQIEFQFWIYYTAEDSDAEPFPDGDSVYMRIKEF